LVNDYFFSGLFLKDLYSIKNRINLYVGVLNFGVLNFVRKFDRPLSALLFFLLLSFDRNGPFGIRGKVRAFL